MRMVSRTPARLAVMTMVAASLVSLIPPPASSHRERPAVFPSGSGSVPTYRTDGPHLVVCADDSPRRIARLPKELRTWNQALHAECQRRGFRNIQQAVDAVTTRGSRILVLPGVYHETPSREALEPECARVATQPTLTYEQQVACPHAQNLIAILGDGPDDDAICDERLCDLQIEGTGASPTDVIVDAEFRRHVVIRADRADGVYFRNFTIQHAPEFGLYILETDGFVIDRMIGRWNEAYGFLTFADDHGKYVDCEAYGNGDSGLYPGAASPQYGARHSIEITRCNSHHNWAGLGGTAGNSLLVHDNDFHHNTVGIALDSVFPNHPGMPQGYSTFVGNRVYSNNEDFYRYYRDGTCAKPRDQRGYDQGVVCPLAPAPIGTGVLLAGGNANAFEGNWIWDNRRYGVMQFWVPAAIRGEQDPAKQFDTSHRNSYTNNHLGASPDGVPARNGLDFWWDEEGAGNCWQDNDPATGPVTSDPPVLPDCRTPAGFSPPNLLKSNSLLPCLAWSPTNYDPAGCNWTHPPNNHGDLDLPGERSQHGNTDVHRGRHPRGGFQALKRVEETR